MNFDTGIHAKLVVQKTTKLYFTKKLHLKKHEIMEMPDKVKQRLEIGKESIETQINTHI